MRFVGWFVILVSIPLFYELMRGGQSQRRVGWFCVGLAPFVITAFRLDVSFISWAFWPGYVKGAIVSLLDTLALAIIVTHPGKGRRRVLLWPFLLFIAGTAVATAFASPMMASAFFTWQLARMFLVFVATSRITTRPGGTGYVIAGMSAGVVLQAYYSLIQRAHGVTQADGTMGHQNLLGLCTHFVLILALAAMLAGDRRWIVKLGLGGALIADVLTGSRATTGLAALGVALLLLLSLIRQPTGVKARIVSLGLGAMLLATPFAYATLQSRFKTGNVAGSDEERAAFERAARAMWSDHPMGVGANQYVIVANRDGYSQRAGVVWNSGSRSANVHNTYLLLGAETGYLGLGTFVVLLFSAIMRGLQLAWSKPRDANGELALGAAVVLIVVALHCLYEWVFVIWVVQYLFAITLGIIAGLTEQRARASKVHHRPARVTGQGARAWSSPVAA